MLDVLLFWSYDIGVVADIRMHNLSDFDQKLTKSFRILLKFM